MSSSTPGDNISPIQVTDIVPLGIWMLCRNEELFLSYENFPWFRDQPGNRVRNVQEVMPDHLYWPDMDVDLCLDSIRYPEKFPLKARQ